MDRTAIFVDAGYLFASGSVLLAKERLPRGALHLDHDVVLTLLTEIARERTGLPLLRIYWYDGAANGPTAEHLALAYRPNVKLRLGALTHQGQQHGVDSLLVGDLIQLARNHAMADAVIVTGDEDIRIGIEQAQESGVRVHLLGIAPQRENQSAYLVQTVDTLRELTHDEVSSFLSFVRNNPSESDLTTLAAIDSPMALSIVEHVMRELKPAEWDTLHATTGDLVPSWVDRRLLVEGTQVFGSPLTGEQKRQLRTLFLQRSKDVGR